ncbi:murein biosynthesis integral membrane protein MurJ [Geodermatophilus sp. CPCC 205506]|uniref:murein biosynthesis integral membrane protein MurJ n=1 Tax=Geodermatophilus sp. CPCC 205506 TaxID=2936596 RepID=UPI003EE85911
MSRGGLARSTALVAGLTLGSQLLGFLRDVVLAAVFGVGSEIDAYLVAQGLMNLVLALMAGAVAKSVVPTVARSVADGEPERGRHSVRVALTVTVLVMLAASVVMAVLARPLVAALAPGFDGETADLAVRLTRLVVAATALIAATNVLAGAAQGHRRFGWAAAQGIPFNIALIVAALGFGSVYGVTALAVGFVVGSGLRLLLVLPPLLAVGQSLRPSLDVRDRGFREMVALVPPLLVGSAVSQVNTLVDRAVGSATGEGAITALNYGWRLVGLADTLVVATVATTLYPALAAAARPGRTRDLDDLVRRGCGVLLLLVAPCVVILSVAAEPVVSLLFERGAFDAEAVRLTALAVTGYAASLVGLALREPATRAFLSLGDSRTPVALGLLGMAVNVVGDLTLGVRFGVLGLAVSTSLSLLLVAALSLWRLRSAGDGLSLTGLGRCSAQVALAAACGAVPAALLARYGDGLGGTAAATASCLTVYLVVLWALRCRELGELGRAVRGLVARG